MQILIISSYYHPEPAGNAPYATGVAEHLAARGHEVTVLTGFAHYPAWRPSSERRLWAHEVRNGVDVRRRWHYVPRHQSARSRAVYEATLAGFGITGLPLRRPDVVVGISPTLAAATLSRAASLLYRRPYGLIFQDLQGRGAAQSGVTGGARIAHHVESAEISHARAAAAVGVIAEGFRTYLVDRGVSADRVTRVRNWAQGVEPSADRIVTRARLGWEADHFVCLHAGNIGHKQGLENVLHAAALITAPDVRIVLAGDGNERGRLEQMARELRLANLSFVQPQPPGQYEAMLAAADVLIVNQRASVGDMSLASKLTSYFMAARPLVAAVATGSETGREVLEADAGIVTAPDDPQALADSLLLLKGKPSRAADFGVNGLGYARAHLSAPVALREYEAFVERIAATASGGDSDADRDR